MMDQTNNQPQFNSIDTEIQCLSDIGNNDGNIVYLLVYDLSHGFAKHVSPLLLGRQIDAVWHTSIAYFGKEYFFGQEGISIVPYRDNSSNMGRLCSKIPLGLSEIPEFLFQEYITNLNSSSFRVGTYDLFRHNCNNFSHEVAQFLTGNGVPDEILSQTQEILSTGLGQVISRYQRR